MKRIVGFGLLLIALTVATAAFRAKDVEPTQATSATPASPSVHVQGSSAAVSAGASNPLSKAPPVEPVAKDEVIKKYRALAECAKYRQHMQTVEIWKQDPFSWWNNDQARAELSPEAAKGIQELTRFIEDKAARCSTESSIGAPPEQIYRAALAAGYAGDLGAANCYVLAPWPYHGNGVDPLPVIREEYMANVQNIINVGLQGGDWGMVATMLGFHGSMTHGLPAHAIPHDPAKAYGYQWLQRLGAEGTLAKQAEDGLEMLASRISPAEIARQERWAAHLYADHFAEGAKVESMQTSCG